MDLGIAGKNAIVCAASKGLGLGCAVALAREGVNVVITARGAEALNATAAEIGRYAGADASRAVLYRGDEAFGLVPDRDVTHHELIEFAR